jgi:hypothetical protein
LRSLVRKLLLTALALLALAAPAAALALTHASNDGTLAIRDATGKIRIQAVGGFLGRVDKGRVTIVDPVDGDGTGPIVSGCDTPAKYTDTDLGGTTAVCSGTKLRFRLVGGKFKVLITGQGIDMSVVGHGLVMLNGAGGDDGRYSLNGDDFRSLPDLVQTFALAAP